MSVKKDHRRSERVPFKRSVKFGVTDPIFYGFAYNLSEGGIGIYCKDLPRLGDNLVTVMETMLDSEFITVNAKVRWISKGNYKASSRFGVKFEESPKAVKNIYRQIKP